MSINRPGTKIPFGVYTHKSKPDVEPPGLLRLLAALAIFSVVGTMLYSALAMSPFPGTPAIDPDKALYIAVLHFLLPIAVAYTIMMNHWVSRFLIFAYFVILYVATLMGKGVLGTVPIMSSTRTIVATAVFAVIIGWLFRGPRMRYYYALLADKPVPDDLVERGEELAGRNWLSSRTRNVIEWFADNLETVVLLGFVVVVIYAFLSTT